MKVYTTQSQVDKDIKNSVLAIEGDVTFECPISVLASIQVIDGNITALDINARDITAWDITARDITASDINARNITAWNITAWDINADNIQYNAFCSVYGSIKCKSIKAKRKVHSEPICLDGEITYKVDETETVQIGDRKYSKSEVKERIKR